MRLQTALHAVFPPECLACGGSVGTDFALCGPCWSETPFIGGACCDLCGADLPGAAAADGTDRCDDCLQIARPWHRGRAVFRYGGVARRLVLGLKHGDRAEVARAAGPWMARAARGLLSPDTLIVPVPLHRWRLFHRRFNQSALLAQSLGRATGLEVAVDALTRPRPTASQDGLDRDGRFANLDGRIVPHPSRGAVLAGRDVLLVDDVMTSGATFSAATGAALAAGAENVCVMALARVGKDN